MKTYSTTITVEAEHLDKGDHANWRSQLGIAEDVHHAFRDQIGIGLERLKEQHRLFLVMRHVRDVFYRQQLRLGDVITVTMTLWIASRTAVEFHCLFHKEERVATEMSWVMPLVSSTSERPTKIPDWMIEIIGLEKP